MLVSYHSTPTCHTGQLVLITSLKNISPPCSDENILLCFYAHIQYLSIHSRGGSPASLHLHWAANNHMEAFFLVKLAGLLHHSSLGTSYVFLLHADAACFEHWIVVKATCLHKITITTLNCRLRAMTQEPTDDKWTSINSTAHTSTSFELKLKLLFSIPQCRIRSNRVSRSLMGAKTSNPKKKPQAFN